MQIPGRSYRLLRDGRPTRFVHFVNTLLHFALVLSGSDLRWQRRLAVGSTCAWARTSLDIPAPLGTVAGTTTPTSTSSPDRCRWTTSRSIRPAVSTSARVLL